MEEPAPDAGAANPVTAMELEAQSGMGETVSETTTEVQQSGTEPSPGVPVDCVRCGQGKVTHEYVTCCGVLLAILCFPLGLLCLFLCRKTDCSNCGRHPDLVRVGVADGKLNGRSRRRGRRKRR